MAAYNAEVCTAALLNSIKNQFGHSIKTLIHQKAGKVQHIIDW